MYSLSARLLLAVSLLLLFFFGVTIFSLELAFRDSAERAISDRLDVQLVMLLSAAEPDTDGSLVVPDDLPEARFLTPGSGLFGQITGDREELLWRSLSSVGVYLPVVRSAAGERRFSRLSASDGTEVLALSLGVEWELADDSLDAYTFTVAESLGPYHEQISQFRRQLLIWFAAIMLLLLLSQAWLLRRLLRPLRQVETEIEEIELGKRSELSRGYPSELQGVAANTNHLIRVERQRLARYRNTLGNLAHSLKTPLAVMRNSFDAGAADSALVQEQIDRMNDIVGYQLQRAAASGGTSIGHEPVDVGEVSDAIAESLRKVYAEKRVLCAVNGPDGVMFYGEKGDLMEMIGNLMDNAFKYCAQRVDVEFEAIAPEGTRRAGLRLAVDDDGSGIPGHARAAALKRGRRVDETVAGHGLGLAVVRELVELFNGELSLSDSPLGGAHIEFRIPPVGER